MTEQAAAKTALDVAREWLDTHYAFYDGVSLAAAIEAYAQAAVQRAREEDIKLACVHCADGARLKSPRRHCINPHRADWTGPRCHAWRLREAHARESEGKEGR